MTRLIAWGAKVSGTFLDRARWIVDDLQIGDDSDDGLSKLLTCMAWETGRTFSPGVLNKAGSGATGLIQFMPKTATVLGTTVGKLAAMTAENQLNYVWKYFQSYKGRLKTLSDLYMAILWPKGVGKPESYVLWDKASMPTTFRQNAGFDTNKDGRITKSEATAKLMAMMSEGMQDGKVLALADENVAELDPPHVRDELDNAANYEHAGIVYDARPVIQPLPGTVHPEYAEAAPESPSVLSQVNKAAKGKTGTLAGVGLIVTSVLANPDFTAKLAGFLMTIGKGEAPWGAIGAVVGTGLIAYTGSHPKQ